MGVPYAHASRVPAGTSLIHLAGVCPLDDDRSVVPGGLGAQAARVVENLRLALDAAGASVRDVAYTRVLVVSARREELAMAWDVVAAFFGDHDVPSTLFGVTALGYPGQLVEVEAVAAVPDSGGARPAPPDAQFGLLRS